MVPTRYIMSETENLTIRITTPYDVPLYPFDKPTDACNEKS